MKFRLVNITLIFLCSIYSIGQNRIDLNAFLDVENKQIRINQTIEYFNTSQDTLKTIYLNDWSNSFSTKTTPLAKRFAEEFSNKFQYEVYPLMKKNYSSYGGPYLTDGQLGSPDPGCGASDLAGALAPMANGRFFRQR